MAAGFVGRTITEITKNNMRFLPVFGHHSTSNITENIKEHLLKIEPVVAKLELNDSTRDWVGQVTDVVTDLFDLLEDLSADAAMLQIQKQSKIKSFFSFSNLTPYSSLLKLKQIEKQLKEVEAHAPKLSLKNTEKLTNSDVEDQEIKFVGSEKNKEEIIKQILSEKEVEGAVPVIVIVGMQGIGKTKLAKLICDDERVKSNFDLMIWIDGIHEQFYAELVVKRMIETAVMKKKPEDKGSIVMDENLNLGETMRGSRFVLVLDDLRNEDREEWLRLQNMLTEIAAPTGGAVIITTQSYILAEIFDSYHLYILFLERLSEEESWSLFEQIAGGGPSDSKITEIVKNMVDLCSGVPVAILTMARLLSSRGAITESEMYQRVQALVEEFLQELKLRYYNELPSWHLKQCFAYFSFVFSTKYANDAETLIRLWMAEGFLGPINSSFPSEPEDLGFECIQEFRRRSIFDTCENEYGISQSCSMDKLMQYLSAFVAGDDCLYMDDPDNDVKERVRRVSLNSGMDVSNGIPKSLFKTDKKLRTILLPTDDSRVPYEVKLRCSACDEIFSAFKSLRVLILQDLGMKMLPNSIGELKSLRYLELSKNNMRKLPNSIGELKHLQTLILSDCYELKELPNDVNHFVSLRHLVMKECLHLTHMPSALKNLTWLRTLSNFVISTTSKNHNRGLGELINLNNLRGELEISHLERLKFNELEHDGHAYLKQKQHLQCLTLRWNHDDDTDEGYNDQISLGYLKPHPNLKRLSIVGYEGNKFSKWLSSLQNLVKFSLYNCSTCKSLPLLDQLPNLKSLQLQRLDSLQFITDEDDGCNELGLPAATKSFFPSLKQLRISDCPNLTSWWKGRTHNNAKPSSFPSISALEIQYCPKLDCMPLYPNLDVQLTLECSSVKPLQETINCITSRETSDSDSDSDCSPLSKLKTLIITNVEEQSPLQEEWLKNFTSLQSLSIRECKGLKSLMKGLKHLSSLEGLNITNCTEVDLPSDEWEGLKNLRSLHIMEIPKLEYLPEGIKHLTSLFMLTIKSCPELTTLTEGISELKSLSHLWIFECHKLASLPQGMNNLTSLNNLLIGNCPLLLPRCQRETGDDWTHIKHIERISVTDTSHYYD